MKPYKSFQICWVIFYISFPILIFFIILNIGIFEKLVVPFKAFVSAYAIFFAMIALFYGMSIKIDDTTIKISFGIGLVSKKILLSDIASTKTTKAKWYNGIGIRLIENGWLYNAHGLDAVELSFKNKKRILQIGSRENTILKEEIDKRLKN